MPRILKATALPALLMVLAVGSAKEPSVLPKARQVWADAKTNTLGAPSRDGRFLSFVDVDSGDLAVLELETGRKRRLTHKDPQRDAGQFAYFSAISPDSRHVAYAWFNEKKFYELRVVSMDGPGIGGSGPRVLYRNEEAGFVKPSAWSPDGKQILTLLFRKDNISQIALVSAQDGSARPLRSLNWVYPKRMDFSPDGRYIVFDSTISDDAPERDIYVLATDGSRQITAVDHAANDLFPLWTPDGKGILFGSDRAGTLDAWFLPVADGEPAGPPRQVKKDLGRFLPLGLTEQGDYYYALRTGGSDVYTATLDTVTGKLIGEPAKVQGRLMGANRAPAWSPDGQYLAYLSRLGTENYGQEYRAISIRDVTTGEERVVAPKLAFVSRLRWSPDGRSLLLSGSNARGRAGLYRLDLEGGEVSPLVHEPSADFRGVEGAWSAAGNKVFYIADEDAHSSLLHAHDIEAGESSQIYRSSPPARLRFLARSPNGRSLAFTSVGTEDDPAEAVLLIPAEGGDARPLLRSPTGGITGVTWTADGKHLLVSAEGKPAAGLWRVAIDIGHPERLEISFPREGGLSLHPDGKQVAYAVGTEQSEIWVMENLLGTEVAAKGAP